MQIGRWHLKGAVYEDPFDGVSLMEARYEDKMIMMFTNDMEEYTEVV